MDATARLRRVTITGAGDSVNIHDLLAISREYPFVEWGILYNGRAELQGGRWPTRSWIRCLAESQIHRVSGDHSLRLSLHLCGGALRDFQAGNVDSDKLGSLPWGLFDRTQLNWHGDRQDMPQTADGVGRSLDRLLQADGGSEWLEVIFQLDEVNDGIGARCQYSEEYKSGLFDCSHGMGILRDQWPTPRTDLAWCGYAGGLGPENIAIELPRIVRAAEGHPFWIDMETRVLDANDCLDLQAVRSVLSRVADSGFLDPDMNFNPRG